MKTTATPTEVRTYTRELNRELSELRRKIRAQRWTRADHENRLSAAIDPGTAAYHKLKLREIQSAIFVSLKIVASRERELAKLKRLGLDKRSASW